MRRLALLSLLFFLTPALAASDSGANLGLAQAEAWWLEHNRELRLARESLRGAEADSLVAGQGPNPQLSLSSTSINPRSGIGAGGLGQKRVDSVLRLEQLFERGGKRELRQQVAGALQDAAAQGLADARRQGLLQLRQAYWDLRLAQERQQVAAESADLYQRSVRATELRLKAGDVAGSDAARLRIELARAENEYRSAQADLEQSRQTLAYILGWEGDGRGLLASDSWPSLQGGNGDPGGDGEVDPDSRPDMAGARSRLKAAEAARDLARSLGTRDVAVGVQFEHYPPGAESPNNTYGFSVSVPLFLNHSYQGEIARAESDLETARTQSDQVRAQIRGDLAQARSRLMAAVERRQRLESGLLAQAEKVAGAAEFAYARGALGLLELLDARRTLRAVRLDAAQLGAEHAKALAAWQAALGK